ncbi:MAG: Holliday junction resolvase RuvX [Acidimicrobiales bacterium]
MRALGVDLGERRIGLAISDSSGTLAFPYEVLERCGDSARDYLRVAALVSELEAELVVVGLPLSLSGAEGAAARRARAEAKQIAAALKVPVALFDERFSTVEAERRRRERTGPGRARRTARKPAIDAEAAAVMLGAFLSAGRMDGGRARS